MESVTTLSDSPAEAAVVAALREADGWVSVDALWHACPGVKRRVVRHHLDRLVAAGLVAWCERIRFSGLGGGRYGVARLVDGAGHRYLWCGRET